MPGLDLTRQRIRERLSKLGMSANEASRRAGLGISYVNDLLVGKSKNPVPHRLGQLAEILECDLDYLLGVQDSPRANLRLVSGSDVKREDNLLIPLYTVGLPQADGFFDMHGSMKSSISVAVKLVSTDNYAIVVPDDSNAPRYFAGEYVIAHPGRPVSRGGFAVIRMKDGRAAIRRVDAIMSDKVVASRLEGGEAVEIGRDEIDAVHRIIGSAELS